jgi:hypothetical protein
MTVRHQIGITLVVMTFALPRPARAEGETNGFAPTSTSGGTGFGAPGQIVISMGPTTDEHLFFHKQSGGGWQLQLSPALDYFLTARVALGGVVGFRYDSGGAGTGTNADGSTRFTLGGRVSTNFDFTDRFGVWPLGGLFFETTSANHTSTTNTWLELYAPFLFHVAPHFFVGAGPSFQLNLSGPDTNQIGVDSVIAGWF